MRISFTAICCTILIAALSGCASSSSRRIAAPRSRLGSKIPTYSASTKANGRQPAVQPQGAITLNESLSLALMHNPELAAASWAVRAAQADARQATLLPNPEIEVEAEEFGGDRDGLDESELTAAISQSIPMGGDRRKAKSIARHQANLVACEREATRLAVITGTKAAFMNLLATRQRLDIADTASKLALNAERAATDRVEAGKARPIEKAMAHAEASAARVALSRTKDELATARDALAAMWGAAATFSSASGALSANLIAPPPIQHLLVGMTGTVTYAASAIALELQRDAVGAAIAQAIPDLELKGAVKLIQETDETTYIAGLGIEIPLFDRNQGGINSARHALRQARAQHEATVLALRLALATAHRQLVTAQHSALSIKDTVLPAAQQAFDAAQLAYANGKSGYLELLAARKTLIVTKEDYVNSLLEYHQAAADLERLTGRAIQSPVNNTNK